MAINVCTALPSSGAKLEQCVSFLFQYNDEVLLIKWWDKIYLCHLLNGHMIPAQSPCGDFETTSINMKSRSCHFSTKISIPLTNMNLKDVICHIPRKSLYQWDEHKIFIKPWCDEIFRNSLKLKLYENTRQSLK